MEIQPAPAYAGQMDAAVHDAAPAAVSHPPQGKNPASLNLEQIKRMVKEMEAQASSMNVSLDFTPYGANNERMAIIVSNKETGKVIREIPPEELQQLYEKMNELAGILLNRSV